MKKHLIRFIKAYQRFLSPFFQRHCRFHPTCSEYAVLSLEKYGVWKGLMKASFRVLRCSPLSKTRLDLP